MGKGGGGLEGENHKRETDCCFRPFSSLPSFHHNSLAAGGGEDGDERRKEERRKGPLLSLLSLLSSSFHQGGNAWHPIFRQVKKQSTFFFPAMSSTRFNRCHSCIVGGKPQVAFLSAVLLFMSLCVPR